MILNAIGGAGGGDVTTVSEVTCTVRTSYGMTGMEIPIPFADVQSADILCVQSGSSSSGDYVITEFCLVVYNLYSELEDSHYYCSCQAVGVAKCGGTNHVNASERLGNMYWGETGNPDSEGGDASIYIGALYSAGYSFDANRQYKAMLLRPNS